MMRGLVCGGLGFALLFAGCGKVATLNPTGEAGQAGDVGDAGSAGSSGAGPVAGEAAGGAAGEAGSGFCAGFYESDTSSDNGICSGSMVGVAGGGFLMDITEVTRGQYASWLSFEPKPDSADPTCGWKTSYAVDARCWSASPEGQLADGAEHPVVCVDWCDARAYCEGVGKRLCGKIGLAVDDDGGPNAIADYADPAKSEWYLACSSGGTTQFPYGDTFDPSACNAAGHQPKPGTLPVASLTTCQSSAIGYQAHFDLSGNVAEWEDSCEPRGQGSSVQTDFCLARGGSTVGTSRCDAMLGFDRSAVRDDVGFRCCAL